GAASTNSAVTTRGGPPPSRPSPRERGEGAQPPRKAPHPTHSSLSLRGLPCHKGGLPPPAAAGLLQVVHAVLLKFVSVLPFAVMSVLVRWLGDRVPLGQLVFFRSFFGILPVLMIYAVRRELMAAVRTGRPMGHIGRGLISVIGMFLSFAAVARLPLADA